MSMLKNEHIKQAIEAIAGRNAEIGYALDEMLGTDRIRPVSAGERDSAGEDPVFLFDGRLVRVRRGLFFDQGAVPIEERLLIQYGMMSMQHQLSRSGNSLDFREAAEATREAGLRLLVNHEIDYALERLQDMLETSGVDPLWAAKRRSRLEAIRREEAPLLNDHHAPGGEDDSTEPHYSGTVDKGLPAVFAKFPFTMDALMQAADINLEFFNIRFLLSTWIKGLDSNLFACLAGGGIEGIVYLTLKKHYFYSAMEIQYIATATGRPATDADSGRKQLKGAGTFLVAGVWMLWKERLKGIKDLLLDSEVGARRFYEGIGFEARGFSGFILKEPRGRLVGAALEMAGRCRELQPRTEAEIDRVLKKQMRVLRKKPKTQKQTRTRMLALEAVKACLQAGVNPAVTRLALEHLERGRRKIPEAEELMARSFERK